MRSYARKLNRKTCSSYVSLRLVRTEVHLTSGIHALGGNLAEDGVFTAQDRLVLVVHDGAGACRFILAEVSRKSRDGGNHDDHSELSSLLGSSDNGLDDGLTNGVENGRLFVSRGSDLMGLAVGAVLRVNNLTEELILNVDIVLSLTDDLLVSILDAMFRQNSTAPVGATSYDLRPCKALLAERLRVERRKRVLQVLAARELRTLNGNQIFVVPSTTLQHQPVHTVVPFVLVPLDEVPPQDEVLCDVIHTVTHHTHGDVVPRHSTILSLAKLVGLPVAHALEIHDAVVVKLLSGEDLVPQVRGVDVGQGMLMSVPSSETQINTSNERQCVVDDNEFLVMRLMKLARAAGCFWT